ncbi:MAG: energy transducer TonB [Verrucomicrobiota bacterium]
MKKFGRRVLKFLARHAFGIGVTLLVFLALPFLQIVANFGKKELEVREVAVIAPPPPPPIIEEPPPPEEAEPEPEPEMQDAPDLSLSDLSALINPGGGGGSGGQLINEALSDAMKNAGDAFSAVSIEKKPRPVYQPPPKYPRDLFKQGVAGVVKIEAVVGVDGRVRDPRVISSPHPLFNDAAVSAVSQWKFEPGMRDGVKVPFKMLIPVRFSLG